MSRYLSIMLLALLPLSNSFAQGEKKDEKKHRLSFVNVGIGLGVYASPDGIPNINLQAIDFNIAPNFAKGFGLRLVSAGSTMFMYGAEWHHMAGPSYTFKFSKSAGTLGLLGGVSFDAIGVEHDQVGYEESCYRGEPCIDDPYIVDPHRNERYSNRATQRDWDYCIGLSYKHRLFSYELFNLSMGIDVIASKKFITVLPNIGCSVSW